MTEDREVRRKSVRIDESVKNCFKRIEILKLQQECLMFVFRCDDGRNSYMRNNGKAEEQSQSILLGLHRELTRAYADLLMLMGFSSNDEVVKAGMQYAADYYFSEQKDISRLLSHWGHHDGYSREGSDALREEIAEAVEWAQAQGPVMKYLRKLARKEKRER